MLTAAETHAKTSVSYQFDIAFESLSFVLNRSDYDINEQETLDASFEFEVDNEKNFKLFLKPRIRWDFLDNSRNRYLPNESYVSFYGDQFEISGGVMVKKWGISNSFNPTDVINRKDLEDNFFTPETLGDVMVSFQYSIPQAGAFQDLTFELIGLPYFQETPLPDNDSRFAIAGSASGFAFTRFGDQELPDYENSWGAAARVAATVASTDVELNFYHGPEKQPTFFLLFDNAFNIRARPFYYTVDMVGLNSATSAGPFVFHLEVAYKITQINDPRNHEVVIYTTDVIPNDYVQFVPGVDYTLDGFLGGGTLVFTLEYLGEDDHSVILEEFRPFKNDIFFGLRYELNNTKLTRLEAGVLKDLTNQEMIVKYEFSTLLIDNLKLNVHGIVLNQASDPQAPLSFFENNTYVAAQLSYSFGGSN